MKGFLEGNIPTIRELFGKPDLPIWLTEFGYRTPPAPGQAYDWQHDGNSVEGNTDYLNLAIPYLDNQNSDIVRYSYLKAETLAPNNVLSPAGQAYLGSAPTGKGQ